MRINTNHINSQLMAAVADAYQFRDAPLKDFTEDAKAFIQVLKEDRLLLQVVHTSDAGTVARFVSVKACEKAPREGETRYIYHGFGTFFAVFGYLGHEVEGVDLQHPRVLSGVVLDGLHKLGLISQEDRCDLRFEIL